ncbi:hypothetical protein C8F04DRAFT_1189928 [Mycena alexandri]|uniref:Uncharacterized protein n=1 Tax=Mycena alexandri TaxID=1745969 RepID=A0AAD6SGG5_9AGAR|nr:hypothetical protein C8F04DRAFT_1189928 [Mycena alexandri]
MDMDVAYLNSGHFLEEIPLGPGKKPWRAVPAVAVLACPGLRLTQGIDIVVYSVFTMVILTQGALDRVVAAYSHRSTAQRQHSTHGRIVGLLDVRYYLSRIAFQPRHPTLEMAPPLGMNCPSCNNWLVPRLTKSGLAPHLSMSAGVALQITKIQAPPSSGGCCLRRPREVFNNLVESPGSSSRRSFRP